MNNLLLRFILVSCCLGLLTSCVSQNKVISRDLNGKFAILDEEGKQLTEYQYDDIVGFKEGLSPVRMDNNWGFIDEKGELVIPLQFEFCGHFSFGFAPVMINGKWGFIDKQGNIAIPAKFDYVEDFGKEVAGHAYVNYAREIFLIDKTGEFVDKK